MTLFSSPYPIAEIYLQATGSADGAIGLLSLVMICIGICVVGLYITSGRTLWALSRDGALPFPKVFSKVSPKLNMPLNATVTVAIVVTILGAIYVGSTTAFNAFVGSFVLLSSSSYVAAILPNLLTGRKNIEVYGPFELKGWKGFALNGIACAYMIVWFCIYSFPYYLPTDATTMNYAALLWGGFTILVSAWWFLGARRSYEGPPMVRMEDMPPWPILSSMSPRKPSRPEAWNLALSSKMCHGFVYLERRTGKVPILYVH